MNTNVYDDRITQIADRTRTTLRKHKGTDREVLEQSLRVELSAYQQAAEVTLAVRDRVVQVPGASEVEHDVLVRVQVLHLVAELVHGLTRPQTPRHQRGGSRVLYQCVSVNQLR